MDMSRCHNGDANAMKVSCSCISCMPAGKGFNANCGFEGLVAGPFKFQMHVMQRLFGASLFSSCQTNVRVPTRFYKVSREDKRR